MMDSNTIRNRLLAVGAVVLIVAALRGSYPVTMPVAATLVVVAAVWPLKPWLDRVIPSGLSYAATVLVLLLIMTFFIGAVYYAIAEIVRAFAERADMFERALESLSARADQWGISGLDPEKTTERLVGMGQMLVSRTYTVVGYLGFIAALVILGLPEVPAMRQRFQLAFGTSDRRALVQTIDEIAEKIRQYISVTALTSVITGVASAAWALIVELALVWGILNFLLNFIPIVGNIVGIIPPTIYAAVQFQSVTMTVVVFLGFAALQLVISNFVYPTLQGRSLSLSPVVILLSLSFWSWMWGVAGALIAIPLTVALLIAFDHFATTKWITQLLSRPRRSHSAEPSSAPDRRIPDACTGRSAQGTGALLQRGRPSVGRS
jgi:AI-2 transport protein TqsA